MSEREKAKSPFSIMDKAIEANADFKKKPDPVAPRPAATCILLRESERRLELFLTKRLQQMRFASGHHVFPGGKVEPADCSPEAIDRVGGRSVDEASSALKGEDDPQRALGFWNAALRELFEEAGVLLAADESGASPHDGPEDGLGALREALLADEIDFYAELKSRRLRLDFSQLMYFDHWVTPEYVPIRFDTRFFLARMPEGVEARHWPGEADEGFWIAPHEALERWERHELMMIPPTFMSIRRLLDTPDALAWARGE